MLLTVAQYLQLLLVTSIRFHLAAMWNWSRWSWIEDRLYRIEVDLAEEGVMFLSEVMWYVLVDSEVHAS